MFISNIVDRPSSALTSSKIYICCHVSLLMLCYSVTEVSWSEGLISAAQTLLNDHQNIIGTLQSAMCLYDPLTLLQLHISTYCFDHVGSRWHIIYTFVSDSVFTVYSWENITDAELTGRREGLRKKKKTQVQKNLLLQHQGQRHVFLLLKAGVLCGTEMQALWSFCWLERWRSNKSPLHK